MTIYRGPGGTGTATSDSDTTEFQEFVVDAQAARDAALAAQTAAELAETNAETAETNAETAETNAETAATNAASSASSAASSASSASSSASSASTSASNASSSASSASTSASAASSSASAASTSASNAATSATNAASSATAAASSATSASSSASTATTQATNAAASASAASTSASSASAAQTAAEAARDAALSAYDNFDDRYLGPKSSDPTLDNDGNALLTGALYFNTSSNVMKVYTGSSWVAAYVSAAGVLLTANNLSDVASTATSRTNLNVPTRTGGDASGTWGIDITGNAATATTATSATSATSATTATNVSGGTASVTSITDSGNLTFTGTGNRITGDFSNATIANRVMFQTSTVNGQTSIGVLPNGTSTSANLNLFGGADPANASIAQIVNTGSEVSFRNAITGTGTSVPMTFYTGGSERVRVNTSGNVGIGTSSPVGKLHINSANESALRITSDATGSSSTDGLFLGINSNGFDATIWNYEDGYIRFATNATERMRINSAGNVGIGTSSPGAKVHALTPSATAVGFRAGNSVSYAEFQVDASGNSQLIAPGGTQIFNTNGSERARIDSSGNVGIGTSSPGARLDVVSSGLPFRVAASTSSGYALAQFGQSATATQNWHIGSEGDGSFRWYNGNFGAGTQRARINSGGQLFTTIDGTSSVMADYGCRAWVNFNGTGTVAIRGSGNVSSITDNGTGDYTVNFTTAMPDANFAVDAITNSTTGDASRPIVPVRTGSSTSSVSIQTVGTFNNNTNVDCSVVTVAVHR